MISALAFCVTLAASASAESFKETISRSTDWSKDDRSHAGDDVAIQAEGGTGWTAEAPMKVARKQVKRKQLAVAVSEGKLYAAGGDNGTDAQASVQIFDPKAKKKNAWSAGPTLKSFRSVFGLAALDKKVYAVGGWDSQSQTRLASMEVLDSTGKGWVAGPSLHTARSAPVVAFDGKLWAVGGWGVTITNMTSVEVFDPAKNTWAAGPPLLTGRSDHSLAVVGSKLYALGGMDDDGDPLTSMEVFDSLTKKWTAAPPMKLGRFQFGFGALGNKLYVVGGAGAIGQPFATTEIFDTDAGEWIAGPSLITATRSFGFGVLSGVLHVVGGMNTKGDCVAKVEAFGNGTALIIV